MVKLKWCILLCAVHYILNHNEIHPVSLKKSVKDTEKKKHRLNVPRM